MTRASVAVFGDAASTMFALQLYLPLVIKLMYFVCREIGSLIWDGVARYKLNWHHHHRIR